MALRKIEVIADEEFGAGVSGIGRKYGALDIYEGPVGADGRRAYQLIIGRGELQQMLDALQGLLGKSQTARIVMSEVQATLPEEPEEPEEAAADRRRQALIATREELYHTVARGADFDSTFIVQTILSTIVAAIGLIENSVAVVIGAMVIAPLLGPNLAFSFGAALGDGKLMGRALATGIAGLAASALLGAAIGATHLFPLTADELLARTHVGIEGMALALASGAAAVLSLSSGLPAALVGVMVAVALLPPTATAGIMFGAGDIRAGMGAALLLVVNIASVNFAALIAFLARGIRPRSWYERQAARQSTLITLGVLVALLAVLGGVILLPQVG